MPVAESADAHLELFPDNVAPLGERAAPTLRALAAIAIATGLLLLVGALIEDARQVSFSYFFGYVFALEIALGSLFWMLIHHVANASWSVGLRRVFENVSRSIIPLAILFVPILIAIYSGWLHDWHHLISQPEPADPHLAHQWHVKSLYFSAPFFLARLAIYFTIWISYSRRLRRMSEQQDVEGGSRLTRAMQWWSPTGIVLLGLSTTFFAFDVLMSLQFSWFSTIFGVYFWVGGMRSSLCFAVLMVLALRSAGCLKRTITMEHLHDAAQLIFGLTVFWAYIGFSQYFLIWYGNVPEETQYFLLRRNGTWYEASIALPIVCFIVPFFLLLPRSHKRSPVKLGFAAAWVLLAHAFDIYWQVLPVLHTDTIHFHWLDVAAILFAVSVVCLCTVRGMQRANLIPIRDARLNETIGYENETP